MKLILNLEQWFTCILQDIKCDLDTRAYIVGVLSSSKLEDMSDQSLVLTYYHAKSTRDFLSYQKIGDWVLWLHSLHPLLKNNQNDLSETLARLSYYSCYKMTDCKWKVYEDLADNLPNLTNQISNKIYETQKKIIDDKIIIDEKP